MAPRKRTPSHEPIPVVIELLVATRGQATSTSKIALLCCRKVHAIIVQRLRPQPCADTLEVADTDSGVQQLIACLKAHLLADNRLLGSATREVPAGR